jgi:hypothetical protein
MGIAAAWPAPAAGEEPAATAQSACHSGPFAASHRPGHAGGGAVPGSQGECTQGSDECRERVTDIASLGTEAYSDHNMVPPCEYVPRQRRAATASRPRLRAKHAAGRQRHAQ